MSKGSKSDESQVQDTVFSYLRDSSRPYSVNDVHNNLQKEFAYGKPAVQRALDQLVDEGTVREKIYGKQKIYFADQFKFTPIKSEDAAQLDTELSEVTAEFKNFSDEVRKMDSEAAGLSIEKSPDELQQENKQLAEQLQQLEQKAKKLKEHSGGVDPVVNRKVRGTLNKHVTEWRKRKRLATGNLDSILESCPIPKKKLMEEIGFDTDEDSGAVIPQI